MTVEKPKASLERITDLAFAMAKKYISKEAEKVISIQQKEGEWIVIVEALERKAIPDTQDLLGRYEIRLSMNGEIIGWTQKMIRRRGDRMYPSEEGWAVTT